MRINSSSGSGSNVNDFNKRIQAIRTKIDWMKNGLLHILNVGLHWFIDNKLVESTVNTDSKNLKRMLCLENDDETGDVGCPHCLVVYESFSSRRWEIFRFLIWFYVISYVGIWHLRLQHWKTRDSELLVYTGSWNRRIICIIHIMCVVFCAGGPYSSDASERRKQIVYYERNEIFDSLTAFLEPKVSVICGAGKVFVWTSCNLLVVVCDGEFQVSLVQRSKGDLLTLEHLL